MKFPSFLKIMGVLGWLACTAACFWGLYLVVEAIYTGQVTFHSRNSSGTAYWVRQPGLYLFGLAFYSACTVILGYLAWTQRDTYKLDI